MMNIKKNLTNLSIIILCACNSDDNKNAGDITGFITDSSNGEIISNVSVNVSGNYTHTDSQGVFLLNMIEVGEKEISAIQEGYSTFTSKVTIIENQTLSYDIQLNPLMLRFDGLYQNDQGSYTQYLRFYDDGTVLSASSTGTPEQVSVWFKKENISEILMSSGTYEIDDSEITFSATSEHGVVDYDGVIDGELLILDTYSNISQLQSTYTYSFVAI